MFLNKLKEKELGMNQLNSYSLSSSKWKTYGIVDAGDKSNKITAKKILSHPHTKLNEVIDIMN